MNKFTNIELGYATMMASGSMAFAKGQATSDAAANAYRKSGNWFYAMIRLAPDFFILIPQSSNYNITITLIFYNQNI